MAQPKSRYTKEERQDKFIALYVMLNELNSRDWAALADLPLRTFFAKVAKKRKEGGSK